MQPHTSYKPGLSFALLLIGPPLSGKTNAAMTFPVPYIFDADDKMGNAIKRLPADKVFYFDRALVDAKGLPVPPEKQWGHAVECIKAACLSPDIQTIVVDSITNLATMLINHILASGASKLKIAGEAAMDMQCWTPFQNLMTKLIMMIKSSGKYTIFTCHEAVEKDEITGALSYKPLIQGALKDKIAGMFTDVWHTEATQVLGAGNKLETKFFVRTAPTARMALGNSLGLPTEFTVSWDELLKFMPK
jgi:hypothetical protein